LSILPIHENRYPHVGRELDASDQLARVLRCRMYILDCATS
jgi:hypothetical protein